MSKKEEYLIADAKHPFMGLNSRICKSPKYFCKLHRVWMSEKDVKKKHCRCKPDFDLMGVHRCGCLERRN